MATNSILSTILESKLYILFTIVFAVIIFAVILKGIFAKDDRYSASFPSARVSIAFALTTYVYIITRSLFVGAISFILSMLIAQIKIENGKTAPLHMIFSALMGILLVLIIYQIVLLRPFIKLL
ncbi:hypothetical protein D3C81_1832900 [compost metagenome]